MTAITALTDLPTPVTTDYVVSFRGANFYRLSLGSIPFKDATTNAIMISKAGGFGISADNDGSTYYGGSAYYSGNWRNTTTGQGGWAIRNTGGLFTIYTGSNPGAAGSVISDMAESFRIDSSGNVQAGGSRPAINTLRYWDLYNQDTGASAGCIYRMITQNAANSGLVSTDIVKYRNGSFAINNGETGSSATIQLQIAGSTKFNLDYLGRVFLNQGATGLQNANGVDLNAPGATTTFNHSGTSSGWAYLVFGYNGSGVGSITQNGTTGVSFNTASDYRLKEDVREIHDPLSMIMKLKPCNFAWKSTGERVNGFIAHEVQEVFPEVVSGVKDAVVEREIQLSPPTPAVFDEQGTLVQPEIPAVVEVQTVPDYQGIDQSKLVPVLTAAIQQLVDRVTQLEEIIKGK